MKEYIILSNYEMLLLCDDRPVTVYIDQKPYKLCTDKYFKTQVKETNKVNKEVNECVQYQQLD